MRYMQDGNLARVLNQPAIPHELPEILLPNPDDSAAERERKQRRLKQEAHIRHQYNDLSRSRRKAVLRMLSIFLVLAGVVGFIVWRSAKVTEMSFLNAGLKRQITEFKKQNSLLQDKISGKSSLRMVKEAAANEYGLQKASPEQIIMIPASISMPATADEELADLRGVDSAYGVGDSK